MEGIAVGTFGREGSEPKRFSFELSPLEVAGLAAARSGYCDLDLKDNDPGQYKIVAWTPDGRASVTAKGPTLVLAIERLLTIFGDKSTK